MRSIKRFLSDESGVLTPGMMTFFILIFSVFGTVLSLQYFIVQKERALGVAESTALATIRAVHEGSFFTDASGNVVDMRDERYKLAFAWQFVPYIADAVSSGRQIADAFSATKSTILPTEGAGKATTVEFVQDNGSASMLFVGTGSAGSGSASTGVTSSGTTVSPFPLPKTDAVTVQFDFTKAKKNSISAGFFNFLSARRDLSVRSAAQAYIPNCSKVGVQTYQSLWVEGNVTALGSSCIRAGTSPLAPDDLAFDGSVNISNETEVSVPNLARVRLASGGVIPAKNLQARSWRIKEMYGFDKLKDEFTTGKLDEFQPDYLQANHTRVELLASTGERGSGINFVTPAHFPAALRQRVFKLNNCGSSFDQVEFRDGVYEGIAIITECRVILNEDAKFNNVALIVDKQPEMEVVSVNPIQNVRMYPSVTVNSREIGNKNNSCDSLSASTGSITDGVLIWTRGNFAFNNDVEAYNSQFISGRLGRDDLGRDIRLADAGTLPAMLMFKIQAGKFFTGDVMNRFDGNLTLNGSSFLTNRDTRIVGDLNIQGCTTENTANRYFRKYFRVVPY